MLQPSLQKNDKKANLLIIAVSVIVFLAVTALGRFTLAVQLPFDKHVFALINAIINSCVTVLLIAGLVSIKQRKYMLHKNIMLAAMALSVLFLVSYICHHLFTNPTKYGDVNHDMQIDAAEKAALGVKYYLYYIMLFTHIILAGIILPFILYSAYRALTGEYAKHKKLVRYTFPLWLYVAITGVLIYVMIEQYY